MARDRDWVDYANLASNVAQNVQLGDMQHKLGAVASAIQEEKATAEREHNLRDAVFQAESLLRSLQKSSKENPRASLALARNILLRFQHNRVTSASFRSYEDKERLRSVVEGHEQFAQECAAGLSPQQQEEAERCGQYLVEKGQLNFLIDLHEKQQSLDSARSELKQLEDEAILPKALGWVGMLLIGGGLLWLGAFAERGRVPDTPMPFLALLIGVGLAVYGSLPASQRKAQKAQAQRAKVKELETHSLPDMIPMLQRTFGQRPVAELQSMRNEREALIADVLGEAKTPAKL